MTSANDRWKDRWGLRLAWATTLSVALHMVLFLLSPSWDRSDLRLQSLETEDRVWIALTDLPPGGRLGGVAPAPPVAGESDTLPPAPEVVSDVAGAEGSSDEVGSEGWSEMVGESLWSRLRGRNAPEPTLAEPEPEEGDDPPEEVAGGPEADDTEIEGAASTVDITAALEEGGLDMDRLSALRPELALVGSSEWIRVRNPVQVERFMARAYDLGRVSREASGQVALTLWIDENGSVEWAEIAESSGRSALDEVALALFNDVVAFEPALIEGVPVSAPATFWITFPWF